MTMRILYLSLKQCWFDMICSGIKKEEYREINDYWTKRLVVSDAYNLLGDDIEFAKFDYIEFTLGYPAADDWSRRVRYECKGIKKSCGRSEWGAEPGKEYYVISIGERVQIQNNC